MQLNECGVLLCGNHLTPVSLALVAIVAVMEKDNCSWFTCDKHETKLSGIFPSNVLIQIFLCSCTWKAQTKLQRRTKIKLVRRISLPLRSSSPPAASLRSPLQLWWSQSLDEIRSRMEMMVRHRMSAWPSLERWGYFCLLAGKSAAIVLFWIAWYYQIGLSCLQNYFDKISDVKPQCCLFLKGK